MQINFNPHLPPGYLETHELDGMSWKSERPVREELREPAVAWVVKKFERDSRQEMERQRQTNTCRTIRKNYTVRNVKAEDNPVSLGRESPQCSSTGKRR